jgi:hypothetical protein
MSKDDPWLARCLAGLRTASQIAAQLRVIVRSPSQRRHALRWLESLRKGYLLDKPSPWITFDAIDFVSDFIRRQKARGEPLRVFEYGSGGSTLFWQGHGAECISIEHDATWSEIVRSRIDPRRVDYRLIAPRQTEEGGSRDPADPTAYASSASRTLDFRDYASAIDAFPDRYFPIVLVDGRARPSCMMHAAPKVQARGLLVLDNADREYYTSKLGKYLTSFRRIELAGVVPNTMGFTRTDVYVRED